MTFVLSAVVGVVLNAQLLAALPRVPLPKPSVGAANEAPALPILAFAERGKQPLVPGPLVRVPRGTTVILTLRNRTDSSLVIGDLRAGVGGDDTLQLAPGATREVRYPLNGAIVVDEPGAAMRDHILVLNEWFLDYDDGRPFEVVSVINGQGWPHGETMTLRQGDSTQFRVINGTALHHPLHLHGFSIS